MRSLLITGTDKPHLNLLLAPLRTMGWEVDLDELECMLANLIHRVSFIAAKIVLIRCKNK